MDYRIIADSCCDMTPQLKEKLGVTSVPLTMTLGDKSFIDDDTLDLPGFMEEMKNCTARIGSASPSPYFYKEAFEGTHTSFAITLSSKLSGSYNSAMLGKSMAEEEIGADVHIFDSRSASAGEVLIALKIRGMIEQGLQKAEIISCVENFIREMKTYFVLENIDNLQKNGRLSKIAGKIISVLNIKPVMGSDGEGNIALFSYARGVSQIIDKLALTIEKSGKPTEGESMVITHCNNPSLAQRLVETILSRYRFKEILMLPTRGLSSLYTDDKGVVMAF